MKVLSPAKADSLPSLITATEPCQTTTPSVQGIVMPIMLKANIKDKTQLSPQMKLPAMRLIQTGTGKKILLTNVSNQTISSGPHMLKTSPSAVTTHSSSQVLPIKSQPVLFPGNKPVMLQILPNTLKDKSSNIVKKINPISLSDDKTQLPVHVLKDPIASTSNLITYIRNGNSRFKVIGKPVPIAIGNDSVVSVQQPIVLKQTASTAIREPINIAPKSLVNANSTNISPSATPIPQKVSNSQSKILPKGLPEPPAYLNINVANHLAAKKPSSSVDEKIKNEPKDDLGSLFVKEQLSNDDGVAAQSEDQTLNSKFFMREKEGRIVRIDHKEAAEIGLDYQDRLLVNQKRLNEALNEPKETIALRRPERKSNVLIARNVKPTDFVNRHVYETHVERVTRSNVLIPHSKKPNDFLNRHVPEIHEERVTSNLSELKSEDFAYCSVRTKAEIVRCNLIEVKSNKDENRFIVGVYVIDGCRYLRIRIEPDEFDPTTVDVPMTSANAYRCPYCKKEFKVKDHVISHIRIHTGERPYRCEICDKRYRQRIDIKRHMRIHTGEKPFKCEICNTTFNQKSNLKSHMRAHTGDRPVKCEVCGKGFSRKTHLTQHLKLHTGEKPYQCQICHRPFRFRSGLQAHERIHSGAKPYACTTCGRNFTQIVGLIRHERTHEGEKPFRCQNCGKSFNTQEILQIHCKKHTAARPFKCDKCNRTYLDRSGLRSHRNKYHSIKLSCLICSKEKFKSRIELREHLREHEREDLQETENKDGIPSLLPEGSHYVHVDDLSEPGNSMKLIKQEDEKMTQNLEKFLENAIQNENPDVESSIDNTDVGRIQVEVELDPDDPMEGDDDEAYSDYEDLEILDQKIDPLAC